MCTLLLITISPLLLDWLPRLLVLLASVTYLFFSVLLVIQLRMSKAQQIYVSYFKIPNILDE